MPKTKSKPQPKPKAKRHAKKSRPQKPPKAASAKPATPPAPAGATTATDCPYRPTTLYGTLFAEGNRGYIAKAELITKVAQMTGKSEKVVGFAFQVLKSQTHRSNGGRSTMITEGDRIKLVAMRHRV